MSTPTQHPKGTPKMAPPSDIDDTVAELFKAGDWYAKPAPGIYLEGEADGINALPKALTIPADKDIPPPRGPWELKSDASYRLFDNDGQEIACILSPVQAGERTAVVDITGYMYAERKDSTVSHTTLRAWAEYIIDTFAPELEY